MSDNVHMVQSESNMIEYLSLSDWPYVMSRQNNQTERDQLMINSFYYMNGAHFHGYNINRVDYDHRACVTDISLLAEILLHDKPWG